MDPLVSSLPFLMDMACPICLGIPAGIIKQCSKGHIVCAFCDGQISSCPICRESRRNYNNRNKKLEEVLDFVKLDCEFYRSGCRQKLTRQELHGHLESCEYRFQPVARQAEGEMAPETPDSEMKAKRGRKAKKAPETRVSEPTGNRGERRRKAKNERRQRRRSKRIMSANPRWRNVRDNSSASS